jgi:hypothetical protein
MVDPEPFDAPLTPDCETVHENEGLVTLLLNVIEATLPEHSACDDGVAVTVGAGFTETVTTTSEPLHPFAVGIIE